MTDPRSVRRIVGSVGDSIPVYAMPSYPAQERSDRTPVEPIPRDEDPQNISGVPLSDQQDSDWCMCAGLSDASRLRPGIHHDEGCIMWQLPDYSIFGPDN
jgi:hypothetical protein